MILKMKKTFKMLVAAALAVLMVLALAGCAGDGKERSVEIGDLAQKIVDGLTWKDELMQVTATFDTSGMVEKTFVVENITVVNGPLNASVTPVYESITVKLIGEEEQIEQVNPQVENIVVNL